MTAARTIGDMATPWPPVSAFNSQPTTQLPSYFDQLNQLLPVSLADRAVVFVANAEKVSRLEPISSNHKLESGEPQSRVWDQKAIRPMLVKLRRTRAYDNCVLMVLTGLTGTQIEESGLPFTSWGMVNPQHSGSTAHSSNVRSLTLLDVRDDKPVCRPLLRSHKNPERTTFDGHMDVVLPSASFVNGMQPEAFGAFVGTSQSQTRHHRLADLI